jgi:hypothetical protein|tara:strand:+ start:3550 stop:3852 length:303 start_codon:yes stop_codon:yes gene_type:complete
MKYMLFTLLLLATPVHSQTTFVGVQPCGDFSTVAGALIKNNESALFTGTVDQYNVDKNNYTAQMVFQVNQSTGTWSLLSLWNGSTACLVASGNDFKPYTK